MSAHHKSADISRNQDFYDIYTESGHGLVCPDLEAPRHEHLLNISNDILGQDVLAAVTRSREIPVAQFMKTFHSGVIQQRRDQWEAEIIKRYGYKSRRDIYLRMDACKATLSSDGSVLEIRPLYHDTLDGFRGFPADEARNVLISASAPPAEIGAAVRTAFERCGRAARLRKG